MYGLKEVQTFSIGTLYIYQLSIETVM